jgi:hypothetical protein
MEMNVHLQAYAIEPLSDATRYYILVDSLVYVDIIH